MTAEKNELHIRLTEETTRKRRRNLRNCFIYFFVFLGSLGASAQTLSDSPKPKAEHRFFDKTNVSFIALSSAAIAADGWTTRQNNTDGFGELNPFVRPFVRSNGMSALYFGGSQAAIMGGMYFLHKTGHHRWERILPLATAGVESFWMVHNLRLRMPVVALPPTLLPSNEAPIAQ